MSFKQINDLRKAGKLDEALKLGEKEFEEAKQPLDLVDNHGIPVEKDMSILVWIKRGLAWVYYEYIKKARNTNDYELLLDHCTRLNKLDLPDAEQMVFDNVAWQVGSFVFNLLNEQTPDFKKIGQVFDVIKSYNFTKPSEPYTFVLKAFHKGHGQWNRYREFVDWWGLENLRKEDFLKEEYNGRKIMAIAEQAYIAYAKELLKGELNLNFEREVDHEAIKGYLPILDKVIEDYPDYQYTGYYKAKLLMVEHESKEEVLKSFLPFAKQKKNDFWVWQVFSELYADEPDIQLSCYCKALSLRTPEDFLIKLRHEFAKILIKTGKLEEAKVEIDTLVKTREEHGWRIPQEVNDWMASKWYEETKSNVSNREFYNEHKSNAEEILFGDIKDEVVAVEFVNKSKNVVNFVQSQRFSGFFKYNPIEIKPQLGQLLAIKIKKREESGFCQIYSVKASNSQRSEHPALKTFNGVLKVNEQGGFGFVEDIFIDPPIIKNYKLQNHNQIEGEAILSFNKKKNTWGWKVLKLIKDNGKH